MTTADKHRFRQIEVSANRTEQKGKYPQITQITPISVSRCFYCRRPSTVLLSGGFDLSLFTFHLLHLERAAVPR
jgi:hypothetical protein